MEVLKFEKKNYKRDFFCPQDIIGLLRSYVRIFLPSKKTYSAFLFSSSRGGLLLSTENGESSSFPPLVESNQKRNSRGIPFEESSAVTPQVEYSFLPPKTDGSPHFLLLWRILLIPSIWGEFFKRGAPSDFLFKER